jgi:hypothetical protein
MAVKKSVRQKTKQRIIQEWQDGRSYKEIAAKYKKTPQSVYQMIRNENIKKENDEFTRLEKEEREIRAKAPVILIPTTALNLTLAQVKENFPTDVYIRFVDKVEYDNE